MEHRFTAEEMIDFGYWLHRNFGFYANDYSPLAKKGYFDRYCEVRKIFIQDPNEKESGKTPIIRG